MRITVVSNLYPPHHVGGYELGCRDVVGGLRARGHEVSVLTSTFRLEEVASEDPEVERSLQYVRSESDGPHDKLCECRLLLRAAKRHHSDVIYFWNQAGLCYWLPVILRWLGWPVAFYLSDGDFVSWRIGSWLAGPSLKNPLVRTVFGETFLVRGKPIVENRACHFASEYLRKCAAAAGIPVAPGTSTVAHWGIDPKVFATTNSHSWLPRRLLYVGQLIPQKGVHTAIAALGFLATEAEFSAMTLTIAGGGMNPDYEKGLRTLPAQLGIADRVTFLGKVPREELPRIYAEHDILVFPSEWEEPFAITPLEAMAAGLVVVGTVTGGSGELFRDRETAMTYATGDAKDCARAIRELCRDQSLWDAISRNGQNEVVAKHTLDLMVDRIEASLESATGASPSPRPSVPSHSSHPSPQLR